MSFGRKPIRLTNHELELRLQKMENRFNNLERHGTISDVKYDKEQKRWYVKFNDGEDLKPLADGAKDDQEGKGTTFKTGWRPWQSFSHGSISFSVPPKKGQKVTYKSPGGYPEQGYATHYHYGPETTSPHDKEDEAVIQIRKPKKEKEEGSGGNSSSGSSSSSSSSSQDEEDQNDDAFRIRTSKDSYTLTIGKIGDSQDASASDGDGKDHKDKTTLQIKMSRENKTLTCGKFKAVMSKEGAKISWGDKVSWELKDGQIESTVDGAKHTLTKDNIVTDVNGTKLTTAESGSKFDNGTVKHNTRNIGDSHTHKGVQPGGGNTQDPNE